MKSFWVRSMTLRRTFAECRDAKEKILCIASTQEGTLSTFYRMNIPFPLVTVHSATCWDQLKIGTWRVKLSEIQNFAVRTKGSSRKDGHPLHLCLNTESCNRPQKVEGKGYLIDYETALSTYGERRVCDMIRAMGEPFAICIFGVGYNGWDIEFLYVRDEGASKVAMVDFGSMKELVGGVEERAIKVMTCMYSSYIPFVKSENFKVFVQSFFDTGREINQKTESKDAIELYENLEDKFYPGVGTARRSPRTVQLSRLNDFGRGSSKRH